MDGVIFRYFPGSSAIHRFDPRFKLPGFAFLCFAVMRSSSAGLITPSLIVFTAAVLSGISKKVLAVDFLKFLPLPVIFFTALFLSEPDQYRFGPAAAAAARFGLIIFAGNLMIQTTSLKDISSAVAWFLKPVPFLNSGRAATMIGLTISLIPVFFNELDESKDALRARGLSSKKRPIRWVTSLIRPLLTRLFIRAGSTAEAMEARCYTDTRSFKPLSARAADWALLGVIILLSAVSFIL